MWPKVAEATGLATEPRTTVRSPSPTPGRAWTKRSWALAWAVAGTSVAGSIPAMAARLSMRRVLSCTTVPFPDAAAATRSIPWCATDRAPDHCRRDASAENGHRGGGADRDDGGAQMAPARGGDALEELGVPLRKEPRLGRDGLRRRLAGRLRGVAR